jgi:arylsulfatase A-like enzyme
MSTNSTEPAASGSGGTESPPAGTASGGKAGKVAGLLIVLIAAGWLFLGRDTGSDDAEHVLVILTDTTRRDSLGCYGAARPLTPHIDQVAAEGTRFEQAIAQSCWTLPTVTSILTGTYASIHGSQGKFTGPNTTTFYRSRTEIPHGTELLRAEGIRTHAIVNVGFLSPALGINRGFERYDFVAGTNWRIRRADASVEAAIEFYRRNSRKNTFLFLHLFDPHLNYDPPGKFRDMFTGGYKGTYRTLTPNQLKRLIEDRVRPEAADRAFLRGEYDGEVLFMDSQIGRLIDALRSLGVYERTTIIIVADHGEEFWDHDAFEHGHSMYQELIHVPLIIKLPARYHRGRAVVSTRVRQIDIMPTVFDVLGIEPPASFDGQSLLPLITGQGEEPPDRPAFSEGTLYGIDKVAYYEGRYKYILNLADGSGELYDVQADPLETDNLLDSRMADAERMRAALAGFRDSLQARSDRLPAPMGVDLTGKDGSELRSQLKALGYVRGGP